MTDARALLERLFDVMDTERWDDVDTVLHPDAVMTLPLGEKMSPAEWIEVNRAYATAVPDSQHTVSRIVADGELAGFEGLFTGHHSGPLATAGGEVPPTGNGVHLPICGMFTYRGDRIISFISYFDRLTLFGQLGIISDAATTNRP
jgi:predicted ester cyclase